MNKLSILFEFMSLVYNETNTTFELINQFFWKNCWEVFDNSFENCRFIFKLVLTRNEKEPCSLSILYQNVDIVLVRNFLIWIITFVMKAWRIPNEIMIAFGTNNFQLTKLVSNSWLIFVFWNFLVFCQILLIKDFT